MQSSQERRSRQGRLPRRGTDRLEDAAAWLLIALALLGLLVALLVGVGTHATLMDRARVQAPDRIEVQAVLRRDEPMPYPEPGVTVKQMTAQYTDVAGRDREVVVAVGGMRRIGETVRIWTDGEGRPAPAPVTAATAVTAGMFVGTGIVALGSTVLLGAWAAVRRFTDARNAAAWAAEWAQVEPAWSGRG